MTASCMLFEQGFELALAGLDGGETFFDAAGGLIDGAGDATDFVLRRFLDASLEIALGNAGGDLDDAFEAASAHWEAAAATISAKRNVMPEASSSLRRTCAETASTSESG